MKEKARRNKIRYNNNYNRTAYRAYTIRLSRHKDADLIRYLEHMNVNEFVTGLIKEKLRNEDR